MTDWDRLNRIELQLLETEALLHRERQTTGDLLIRLARMEIERDSARTVAVTLENEIAARLAHAVDVPYWGTAT